MISLVLDASTYRGTVAVLDGRHLIAETSASMRGREAEHLMPAVMAVLADAGVDIPRVGRIICGAGPGSFTSLRIAASIAKGLAVGRGVPLFAVSSLSLIVAANVLAPAVAAQRYLAVQDALRGDSYVAELEHDSSGLREVDAAHLMPTEQVSVEADRRGARAVGPELPGEWLSHARGAARLLDRILAAGPVEVGSWEPRYGRLAEAQVKWEATHGRTLAG